MKYCVCYDASEHSTTALDHVMQHVKEGDQVTLLAVVKPSKKTDKETKRKHEMEEAQSSAKQQVSGTCACETHVIAAKDPREAIVEYANETEADCIIMGTRGLGAVKRAFIGSVSTHVLNANTKAAVYIVGKKIPVPQRKWLLCVDNSEASQRSCKLLAHMLHPKDAVHVVSFYLQPEPAADSGAREEIRSALTAARQAAKAAAEDIVKGMAANLMAVQPDINITASVVETVDIRNGIVEYISEKGGFMTVIMGSRGLKRMERFYLGSTTNHVLHHGSTPLCVVH